MVFTIMSKYTLVYIFVDSLNLLKNQISFCSVIVSLERESKYRERGNEQKDNREKQKREREKEKSNTSF